jgi:hypothetical protein
MVFFFFDSISPVYYRKLTAYAGIHITCKSFLVHLLRFSCAVQVSEKSSHLGRVKTPHYVRCILKIVP